MLRRLRVGGARHGRVCTSLRMQQPTGASFIAPRIAIERIDRRCRDAQGVLALGQQPKGHHRARRATVVHASSSPSGQTGDEFEDVELGDEGLEFDMEEEEGEDAGDPSMQADTHDELGGEPSLQELAGIEGEFGMTRACEALQEADALHS